MLIVSVDEVWAQHAMVVPHGSCSGKGETGLPRDGFHDASRQEANECSLYEHMTLESGRGPTLCSRGIVQKVLPPPCAAGALCMGRGLQMVP